MWKSFNHVITSTHKSVLTMEQIQSNQETKHSANITQPPRCWYNGLRNEVVMIAEMEAIQGTTCHVSKLCLVAQLCPKLCDAMDCNLSGSSVHGDSPGRTLSGLPCPPPGDLPNPGIKSRSLTWRADSLPSEPPGKPWISKLLLPNMQLTSNKNQS